nr:5'-nucleotidase C-terminal domain-containing protein [Gracilibacillus halotolerans]
MEEDKETVKSIDKWHNLALEKLATPITTLDEKLEIDWYTTTPLMEMLTKRLKDWVNADIAMLNAGLILEGLPKGKVTYGDIHRICPHPINPCTTELRGIEIMEIVRGAYDPKLIHLQLIGFGFRGKVIGKFIFDGLQIDSEVGDDGIERVREVSFQGEPLDMNRTYRFVTADMFNFGQMFPEIVRAQSKTLHLPDFLRNVLADALRNYQ